jgi:hypothetical protein
VQTFRSGRFSAICSAILGVLGGGTAILGVLGGGTAPERLESNVRLLGQVVLSFGLQPPAPLHHRMAVSQPFLSPKYKFSGVRMENSARSWVYSTSRSSKIPVRPCTAVLSVRS